MTSYPAFFTDGVSAGRHLVSFEVHADDLRILFEADEDMLHWPLEDIRGLRDQAENDRLILRLDQDNEARLVVERTDAMRCILRTCPNLDARSRDPLGTRRILMWAGGAVASFLVLLFIVIPALAGWLAPLVPKDTQVALGAQIQRQAVAFFAGGADENPYCLAPNGNRALRSMTDRLVAGTDLPFDLQVSVADAGIVNAFAMPGGHIVLLRGLIDEAEGPDEVAAVLAHEIGHVAARDPLRAALRSAGSAGLLSIALGDFLGGGVIATLGSQAIDAHYSRTAETNADAYAARLLADAGVPPDALARFFDRLAKESGPQLVPPYFSSHPPLAERSAALREESAPSRDRPILSSAEWQALSAICKETGADPSG